MLLLNYVSFYVLCDDRWHHHCMGRTHGRSYTPDRNAATLLPQGLRYSIIRRPHKGSESMCHTLSGYTKRQSFWKLLYTARW